MLLPLLQLLQQLKHPAACLQDVYPGHLDVVISGVVNAGEEYEDTAARYECCLEPPRVLHHLCLINALPAIHLLHQDILSHSGRLS